MSAEPTTHVDIHINADIPDWAAMRMLQLCDQYQLTVEQYALSALITLTAQHIDD